MSLQMDDKGESDMEPGWIVVTVDPYYPSVRHFKTEEEAWNAYHRIIELNKEHDAAPLVHLSQVKDYHFHEETAQAQGKKTLLEFDVEWGTFY